MFQRVFSCLLRRLRKTSESRFQTPWRPKSVPPVRYEPKMGHFEKKGGTLRLFSNCSSTIYLILMTGKHMKSTFRILFLARWELEKNDKVPLCARITIDGERVKFSLKSEVTAKIWDPKSGRATVQTKEALQLNRYLDSIKGQMIMHYHIHSL